ncbi:hypothetical protein BD410DRAFT_807400 [Rickenella mellea]|uniref:Uncharacterized protein n=1 Tax=Rickenella mellea TaxID=50990 RepID=A0A4Y7PPJ4_9AGAM|nr:hypothetical protein BD410DRAFT_807400 [Rickenella mellea]
MVDEITLENREWRGPKNGRVLRCIKKWTQNPKLVMLKVKYIAIGVKGWEAMINNCRIQWKDIDTSRTAHNGEADSGSTLAELESGFDESWVHLGAEALPGYKAVQMFSACGNHLERSRKVSHRSHKVVLSYEVNITLNWGCIGTALEGARSSMPIVNQNKFEQGCTTVRVRVLHYVHQRAVLLVYPACRCGGRESRIIKIVRMSKEIHVGPSRKRHGKRQGRASGTEAAAIFASNAATESWYFSRSTIERSIVDAGMGAEMEP